MNAQTDNNSQEKTTSKPAVSVRPTRSFAKVKSARPSSALAKRKPMTLPKAKPAVESTESLLGE